MKILPCMSRGVCFRLPDGSVVLLPLHVFRSGESTVIRIGDTALYFNEDGTFDGEECHMTGAGEQDMAQLQSMLKESGENQGEAPETPYFGEGSPGREREERSVRALEQSKPGAKPRVYEYVGPDAHPRKPPGKMN